MSTQLAPEARPAPTPFTHDVAVVGLGYVGLPTALAFAAAGCNVLGLDASAARLDDIAKGDVDLVPADHKRLKELAGRGLATTTDARLLRTAAAVIVCVPTPVDEHLSPDLGPLSAACADVVANAVPGQLLVLTSTTYVGCTRDLLCHPLLDRGLTPGDDVCVAFSPERIDPANTAFPQESVPRVVGGATPDCTKRAADVLSHVVPNAHGVASLEAAELTKLYENTFRAVNIALANELADAAAALGVDPVEVIGAAATKPFGFMPFFPGPGVGGHCIPCDPHYLLWQLKAQRVSTPVMAAAMEAISLRPQRVVARATTALSESGRALAGSNVLVLGVAYKPGVQDVRESPALEIIERLEAGGARVAFHDPFVGAVRLSDGTILASIDDPGRRTWDMVLIHTDHPGMDLSATHEAAVVVDATYRADLEDVVRP